MKTIDGMHFGRNTRVFQTNDQGIAVFSLDSLKLYKFNSCGNPEWAKQYNIPTGPYFGFPTGAYPGNIIKTRSGFALLSRTPSGNIYYSVVTLLDASGTIVWSRSLEDPNYSQFPYTISEDSNGDFILFGNVNHNATNQQNNFISKISLSGNHLWTRFYNLGSTGNGIVCSDNNILARFGNTAIKTDPSGNKLWAVSLASSTYYSYPVEVSDGYIFIGSSNNNNISFEKVDKQGNAMWSGRKYIDYPAYPSLVYRKTNGNFAGVFNKLNAGLNYATIIEFDKDLNIVRQSTLDNSIAGVILQGLDLGFSDENQTLLAGLTIANAAGSKLFFAKTDNQFQTGCDITLSTSISTEINGPKFPLNASVISHTFNLVNRSFTVKTIPAVTTTHCSKIVPAKMKIHGDSILCENSALVLKENSGNFLTSYLWSTGETTASISVIKPGKYWLNATADCGAQTVSDTVTVTEITFPQPTLTSDTAVCQNGPVLINAEIPGAIYKWQDGSTNAIYQATKPGKYDVEITYQTCTKKFSVSLGGYEKLVMPNIFTPNNDGRNDVFTPMEMCGIASGTLKIYNRWGQLIYETSEIGKGWTGRVNGQKTSDGVYFYLVEYANFRNERRMKKGWLELAGN